MSPIVRPSIPPAPKPVAAPGLTSIRKAELADLVYQQDPMLTKALTAGIEKNHSTLINHLNIFWSGKGNRSLKHGNAACEQAGALFPHSPDKAGSLVNSIYSGKSDPRLQDSVRAVMDQIFQKQIATLHNTRNITDAQLEETLTPEEMAHYRKIRGNPMHLGLRALWAIQLQHPMAFNTAISLATYTGIEMTGQLMHYGEMHDWGRIGLTLAFSVYNAWELPKLIDWFNNAFPISSSHLDPNNESITSVKGSDISEQIIQLKTHGKALFTEHPSDIFMHSIQVFRALDTITQKRSGEIKRTLARLFVFALPWTLRYVFLLDAASSHRSVDWRRIAEKTLKVFPASVALVPIDWMIQNRVRRQFRFAATMARGLGWSVWNTFQTLK